MSLIVENAASFNETAGRLYDNGDARASEIMRDFAKKRPQRS
ncbi:MAG: hypothetical protein OXH76_15420 [Boseongicola sp.]|nr:hypothetical protein [Boseongicola sp.]